jgi:hypothetical protein
LAYVTVAIDAKVDAEGGVSSVILDGKIAAIDGRLLAHLDKIGIACTTVLLNNLQSPW